MSGIFGYIGNQDCRKMLISGISALNHRGGEASGIALKINEDLVCVRNVGTVDSIVDDVDKISVDCPVGLAQTSRCTRSKPSSLSTSPACNNMFAVAMDGRVDNFYHLKSKSGNPFPICTDEDLVLALLCISNSSNRIEQIYNVSNLISGSPSFAFFCSDENAIFCKKGIAPLYIGVSKNGYFLSSELGAMRDFAIRYLPLEDGDIARISADRVAIFDSKKRRIKRSAIPFPSISLIDKDYPVSDEVFYCPLVVKSFVKKFVDDDKLMFSMLKFSRHSIEKYDRIIITGEGSSYYSALLGASAFGVHTDVPAYAVSSGELQYSTHVLDKDTLVIVVSNSGETESTILATKRAISAGCRVIAITSNSASYLADLVETVIDPIGDFDTNDVSLRSFISSYLVLAFLALFIGAKCGVVSQLYMSVVLKMAESLSGKVSSSVKSSPTLFASASVIKSSKRIVTTGYLGDNALALEAGSRLRKLANINSVNCSLDQLEEQLGGNIRDSLLIAFISDDRCLSQILAYLRRAKSLGANVVIYTATNIEDEIFGFDNIVSVNDSVPLLNAVPIISSFYKTVILANEIDDSLQAV